MKKQNDQDDYPRLRPVEAFPIEMDGQRQICLRDPFRVCENPVLVLEPAFFILTKCNGRNSVEDIQKQFEVKFGQAISADVIAGLLGQLDSVFLLDNDHYREHYRHLSEQYAASDKRPSALAGKSYEADPAALRRNLDELFSAREPAENGAPVRGIIAPHIDITVGGPSFASAYSALKNCDADLYIILGTAHMFSENLFTVTPKDYETPLGDVPVDREAIAALRAALGDKIFAEDFIHRNEHSIEFQALFLRYALGPDNPAKILPILVSSFHELLASNTAPSAHPEISALTSALRDIASTRKTCFIAGVDLAHVGRKFGDPAPPSDADLKTIESRDMELSAILGKLDTAAYFAHFTSDDDARRVCGFPPLAVFLNSINADRGEVITYDQAVEEQTGSVVSFVSMVFY